MRSHPGAKFRNRLFLFTAAAITLAVSPVHAEDGQSICYGTTSNGRLENAVALPSRGPNFESYTSLGGVLGRTYVHSRVRDVVVSAYRSLEASRPGTVYIYGETGKKNGGPFKPHRTHQNGLSVDFMVPVADLEDRSVPLPATVFNKFGYGIEFDSKGRYGPYRIDFEAMAAHLLALKQSADEAGIGLWRVIFDPELQPYLLKAKDGPLLEKNSVSLTRKRSWVRHDEHYHVDFIVPCEEMGKGVQ